MSTSNTLSDKPSSATLFGGEVEEADCDAELFEFYNILYSESTVEDQNTGFNADNNESLLPTSCYSVYDDVDQKNEQPQRRKKITLKHFAVDDDCNISLKEETLLLNDDVTPDQFGCRPQNEHYDWNSDVENMYLNDDNIESEFVTMSAVQEDDCSLCPEAGSRKKRKSRLNQNKAPSLKSKDDSSVSKKATGLQKGNVYGVVVEKEVLELRTAKGLLYHIGDGYFYNKTRYISNFIYIKCREKNCPVRGKVDQLTKYVSFTDNNAHSHSPQKDTMVVEHVRKIMLYRCENELSLTPYQIYKDEIAKHKDIAEFIPFSSFKRTMQRKRKIKQNAAPKPVFRYDLLETDENTEDDCARKNAVDTECGNLLPTDVNFSEVPTSDSNREDCHMAECYIQQYCNQSEAFSSEEYTDSETCSRTNQVANEPRLCACCNAQKSVFSCMPCEHLCLCIQCEKSYIENICPECNTEITRTQRIVLVETAKGSLYHGHNGYYYRRCMVRGNRMYLKCYKTKCAARGRTNTNLNEKIMLSPSYSHSHRPEFVKVCFEKLRKILTERVVKERNVPLLAIIEQEMKKIPEQTRKKVPIEKLIQQMYRKRTHTEPPQLPENEHVDNFGIIQDDEDQMPSFYLEESEFYFEEYNKYSDSENETGIDFPDDFYESVFRPLNL